MQLYRHVAVSVVAGSAVVGSAVELLLVLLVVVDRPFILSLESLIVADLLIPAELLVFQYKTVNTDAIIY